MGFDPSQNSTVLAALVARCDGQQFALSSSATARQASADHPLQLAVLPVTNERVALAWSAVYRGLRLQGQLLVVDADAQSLGEAILLASATEALDLVDVRLASFGFSSSALGASPDGGVQSPNASPNPTGGYNPLGKGDARWTGAPKQPPG